jgi:hypothetical protein
MLIEGSRLPQKLVPIGIKNTPLRVIYVVCWIKNALFYNSELDPSVLLPARFGII